MILGSPPIQGRNADFPNHCYKPLFSDFDSCVRKAADMSQFEIEVKFYEPYKYPPNLIDFGHYREYTYTIYGGVGVEPGNGGHGGRGADSGKPGVIMIEGLNSYGPLSNKIETRNSEGRYHDKAEIRKIRKLTIPKIETLSSPLFIFQVTQLILQLNEVFFTLLAII